MRTFGLFILLVAVTATPSQGASASAVKFADVTKKARITFTHQNGASGQKYFPEAFGSGVCVIDYNGDGWPDLFFVNGRAWTAEEQHAQKIGPKGKLLAGPQPSFSALYRNNRNGTFTDVTRQAGLAFEAYGTGCGVGDYDNDGAPDLLVTAYGQARLFRNIGKGHFRDVTAVTKLDDRGWSACAVWFDFDRDGDLDLLICHYVQWTPQTDLVCGLSGKTKLFCGPDPYRGESNRLYRNDQVDGEKGQTVFTDVTDAARLLNSNGKTLGAALLDFDGDGWVDLAIANDQVPNFLYRNNRDGTFTNESTRLGFSVGRFGIAKAGMGIDAADYLNNGNVGILVGNFSKEGLTLHAPERRKAKATLPSRQPALLPSATLVFKDRAPRLGLTKPSLPFLTFGLAFLDANLDGWLDIVTANGHIDPVLVSFLERNVTFRQRPLFFTSRGGHREKAGPVFEEIGEAVGLTTPMVGRGFAFLDFDQDGDLDLVFTENGGPAHLYRNDRRHDNHWLRVSLEGTRSNRSAIGAVVTVSANGIAQTRMVKTGSSYLSQSELTLTFGLGSADTVDQVEIRWPSGRHQTLDNLVADQHLVVVEPPSPSPPPTSGGRTKEGD